MRFCWATSTPSTLVYARVFIIPHWANSGGHALVEQCCGGRRMGNDLLHAGLSLQFQAFGFFRQRLGIAAQLGRVHAQLRDFGLTAQACRFVAQRSGLASCFHKIGVKGDGQQAGGVSWAVMVDSLERAFVWGGVSRRGFRAGPAGAGSQ